MLRGYPLGEFELATLATNLNEVRAVSLTRVLPNEGDRVRARSSEHVWSGRGQFGHDNAVCNFLLRVCVRHRMDQQVAGPDLDLEALVDELLQFRITTYQ